MTTFTLHGAEDLVLLHHLAAYGLADILDTASPVTDLRLTWQAGRPAVSGTGLAPAIVENTVQPRRRWLLPPQLAACIVAVSSLC
jgi:hypothetical protein